MASSPLNKMRNESPAVNHMKSVRGRRKVGVAGAAVKKAVKKVGTSRSKVDAE